MLAEFRPMRAAIMLAAGIAFHTIGQLALPLLENVTAGQERVVVSSASGQESTRRPKDASVSSKRLDLASYYEMESSDSIAIRSAEPISLSDSSDVINSEQTRVTDAVSWNASAYLPLAEGEPSPDAAAVAAKEKQKKLQAAANSAYKPVFWNNDFSYLDDPAYCDRWFGDNLKRIKIGPCGNLDIGGSYRARFHNEQNHRGLGLTGRDDTFLLHQSRIFADWKANGWLRTYAEYIDAESNYEDFPPRGIEVNRSDFLNIFADVLLLNSADASISARLGRQELIYGAQRLISPLPWGNTRRNFEGGKIMSKLGDWSIDGFWTNPVQVNPNQFDGVINSQELSGIYASKKLGEKDVMDTYWIRYLETDAGGFKFDTFGGRLQGEACDWSWDLEGAVQTGDFNGADHFAGFWVLGGGYQFKQASWTPKVMAYYDWASGDETLNNGFHHLFPLAHKYNGFMDLFGRRNLEDANVVLTMNPADNLELMCWYHLFYLQDGDDVPYNVNMTPFVNTPGGSQYLGQEIDLTLNWKINNRSNVLFGYSHFFSGSYYDTQPLAPFANDADFFYTQYLVNF